MKFTQLEIPGVYLIELEKFIDERGSFARQFCRREFQKYGIDIEICQCNISENYKKGTLRGLHYQKEPYPEPKIVSCMTGSIFDVIVDLRKDSPTYLKHLTAELSGTDNKFIYIPPNLAHGFQTLEDNSTVYYQLGNYFYAEYYAGLRWNDPALGIVWPDFNTRIINDRDNEYELIKS